MLDTASSMFDYDGPLALTEAQRLAEKARQGLRMVASGEDQTMDGWLMYGAALNAGRKLLASDNKFHAWKALHVWSSNLDNQPHCADEQAAMWAASESAALDYTKRANPRVRTLRGLHAKWKEAQRPQIEPEREPEEATEKDLRRMEMLRDTINHPNTEPHIKANAQTKLNDYLERFGKVEPETARQALTKKELSAVVTKAAMKKAPKHPKAFEILDYAIRHTYGASSEYLEEVLKTLNNLR